MFIKDAKELVTTHEQTRTGFLSIALEKNRLGDPYVKAAYAFKNMTSKISKPQDLLKMNEIRPFLLAASGLSDKALTHLNESDQTMAINELIKNFLAPAGDRFIDECIYRYLLIKGDSVGGSMRNRIGALGQERLTRGILSCMKVRGITYQYLPNTPGSGWVAGSEEDADIERNLKALYWSENGNHRILAFNLTIPQIKKNVDICLFDAAISDYNDGKIVSETEKYIMLGELKGGIDPAGADEHWKTANSALERIRSGFKKSNKTVKTSFIGAAIENAMATEIFNQLKAGTLDCAANLTNDLQLTNYSNWILGL